MLPSNVDQIVSLFKDCQSESVYKNIPLDEDELRTWIVASPENILLVREEDQIVGVLFAFDVPITFSADKSKLARELIWYVSKTAKDRKRHWMKLLEMYEEWAKDRNCTMICLGSYSPTLTKVYETLGYRKNCDSLFKELT